MRVRQWSVYKKDIPKAAKFWCNATALNNVKKTMQVRQWSVYKNVVSIPQH